MTLKEFFERYGVTLAIVTLAALVVAVLPGNASGSGPRSVKAGASSAISVPGEGSAAAGDGADATGALGGDASSAPGAALATGGRSATGGGGGGTTATTAAGAKAAGGGVQLGVGPCRSDGRMAGIAPYMPPCLSFSGDNGGATARGVSKDKVLVIRYLGQTNPGTQAILTGAQLSDSRATQHTSYDGLRRYANNHYETYGREVVFEDMDASGAPDNDEASRADALKIADEKKAFAVVEGDPGAGVPKVLAQELAQRGVICICATSLSSQFYKENPPYIFSSLPTSTEYARVIGEYVGKRLANHPAKWAGDEQSPLQHFQTQTRKFGLIYVEGANGKVDPEGKRARDAVVAELAKYGVTLSAEYAYLYDPGRNQQDVTNMIATMKAAGVTTIIPLVDPLYPILITKEATNQQYWPEWLITGTGLSDTTTAGRLYDQSQWRHAFGISPLWVTWKDVKQSDGYREMHHGAPEAKPGDEGVLVNIYRSYVQALFIGIHMAGPDLTPDTFMQGMFNYPKTGGTPGVPLVYMNRDYPTMIKDFTEVWYGADVQGNDERGQQGSGMVMKVDQGKRYLSGSWPTTEPKAFVPDNAIATSDNPPGGGSFPHEQDGHTHPGRCIHCT
ncbi:MAG TPA: hypothetical protein VHN98_10245 [Acidimicrobiales bacterium]|nr:hypothetical protein [Acidimicrobiales bacterium]